MSRQTFRIALRKFDPFSESIQRCWEDFRRQSGCSLELEAESLDLHPLYDSMFAREGLKSGHWDIGLVVTDWIAEAHATGALLDLSPFIAASPPDGYPSGWTDSLLRFQRFGDRVLGIPYHDGPETLIYRTDLVEGPGQPPIPKTWEEFHQTARQLSDPERNLWGTVFAAYPDGHNTIYDFCLQLWTRGGELFDSAGNLVLDTAEALEALRYYQEILHDATAVHPKSPELDSVESGLAFARGEIAMMVNWFGFAAMSETLPESQVKGKVGIAPLPCDPRSQPASLNAYWLLGIGSGSPHPDVAWEFIKHCASPANDKALTLGGGIGCRLSTWEDAEVNRTIPFYQQLESIHAFARELPRMANWSRIAAVIDELVTGVLSRGAPIEELLQTAQEKLD